MFSAVAPVRPGENAVAEEVLVPAMEHLRPGGVLIASGRARVEAPCEYSAVEFEVSYVSTLVDHWQSMPTILMHLPCRRSGARLGDRLSAVVWSLAESCRRGDEPLERVRRVMDTPVYYSARNKFERFRWFLELISRFEFEFCRCVNYFFEGFEFLVCSCECAVACLYPRNSISNVVASLTIDDNTYIYICKMYIYIYM